MPYHGHAISDPGHAHAVSGNYLNVNNVGAGVSGYDADVNPTRSLWNNGAVGAAVTGIGIQPNGGSVAHTNVQHTMILNKIIKT
jgi:microcystin-dependent protein